LTPRIREIEDKYIDLISTHNTLVRIGKGIIPEEEISRTTVMLYEKLPEYWVRGNYVELERLLESLENFILFYDGIGQKELEMAERKRPGFIRNYTVVAQSVNGRLTPLIDFAHTLVDAIDSRDRKMPNHSTRVTELTIQMAKLMNWNDDELEYLELAALLHDGKLSIPEHILSKTDPLSIDEWKIIQQHPSYGASVLNQ
jgi:HD-GYP domain-containing protein (c-di-GMP phosphodiesterase class II)